MKFKHPIRDQAIARILLAVLIGTGASAAQARSLAVNEGDSVSFDITVTKASTTRWYSPDPRIRVYYAHESGGSATPGHSKDGADHEPLNPGVWYVEGVVGEPITIKVKTHSDDNVEGDETFRIKVHGIKGISGVIWGNTPLSNWQVSGLPDVITIKDMTHPIDWSLCWWGC